MKEERDFLIKALQKAGVKGKIHESMKTLKNCSELHVGAVLRVRESFTRSGSKKRYTDQEGQRKQRNKLFDRITVLHVVIADTSEDKVEEKLSSFLTDISKGFPVNGNWIDLDISEAEWLEDEDTILKAKIAVEFDVTLKGGIYVDTDVINIGLGEISGSPEREDNGE